MKIIMATGVFPPDIGGPATYSQILYKKFPAYGQPAAVITYGDETDGKNPNLIRVSRKNSFFKRNLLFLRELMKLTRQSDIIYSFDAASIGILCVFVKFLKNAKLIFRIGGDRQWEKAVQNGHDNTLEEYYKTKKFGLKEKMEYQVTNFVLKKADRIIFNSELIKNIYIKYRNINKRKTCIIKNIRPENFDGKIKARQSDGKISPAPFEQSKTSIENALSERCGVKIIYAGRLVAFKNIIRLVEAFVLLKKEDWFERISLEIVGEGPEKEKIENCINSRKIKNVFLLPKLSRQDLLQKISEADIIATVSLTEVNSNFISEAISQNKEIILTDKSELFYIKKNIPLISYVNPLSVEDISEKLRLKVKKIIENKGNLGNSRASVEKEEESWELEKVIKENLSLFESL